MAAGHPAHLKVSNKPCASRSLLFCKDLLVVILIYLHVHCKTELQHNMNSLQLYNSLLSIFYQL